MIIDALKALENIECDYENVSNICREKLSDYNYSFGSSKIVIYLNSSKIVLKKIFGNASKDEVEIYKLAKEAKVNKFFATSMLVSYSGNIYVQQAVDISLSNFVSNEKKEKGRIIAYGALREDYKKMGLQDLLLRSDCCVIYYLLRDYELEEVLVLQKFIVEQDLTDLQLYNAGFYNGKIVFFDYSGIDMELME